MKAIEYCDPHTNRVTRLNFLTGMIEVDPYPIEKFVAELEKNPEVLPDYPITRMDLEWGWVWRAILSDIKERMK